MMSLMVLTSACNNDNQNGIDEESEIELSTEILEQTTWKATLTVYYSSGKEDTYHCMLQFLTEKDGKYVDLDDKSYGNFTYSIDRKLFSFRNFYYSGEYIVTKATENNIVLQNYYPERVVIIMEKQ